MTDDEGALAVIGLACRVPGAPDAATFWRNLVDEVDSVRRYTADDLRAAGVPARLAGWVPAYGHLDGLADFDAGFFGYPVAEAALVDPQQRLFLEVAYAAVEDAGYDPARSDATFGVFAGAAANRYFLWHLLGNPAALPDGVAPVWREDWEEAVPGSPPDFLPLRVAYKLGLTGPAVAAQTACSSSLVAVCQAAQSLLDFRCDIAIAGGAAVISTRQAGYRYRPGGMLSPDGNCRPFDVTANGMVFGNGAGAVVLKRLAEAVADGDHVHAVLRGWAVTNDGGARAGFTAPGVDGQAAAIVEAMAAAGVSPDSVGLVEAHASSTPVGDTIEVAALRQAYRRGTDRVEDCALGSAKANVGSLDAAAGVVGLIKAVHAVRDGVVPADPGFTAPHPDLDLAGSPFFVPAKTQGWPIGDEPRRAAVSSFGMGGTNAHVVVEQPPVRPSTVDDGGPHTLELSAATPTALAATARRLADHLTDDGAPPLSDVAYTLAVGRARLAHRATVTCRTTAEAVESLRRLASGDAPGHVAPAAPPRAGRRVPLPTYPFERRRCWIDPPDDADAGGRLPTETAT
ncbi:beta-ketoacyl synthase N-terminal-like domain-containing protein [Virgisporangium aurantiacum]|uniref:Ketosynthase family 3 (KS3) domain-containing protein n=1 Tax=Virgisporangium aurantiacum TaxID=175570 RepID=A0A8J3ZJJ3_9ACTN|nr:polyketide synthase [Virgisporangium aurantiacum]GIJ64117.1 hypothetical protein Vau01_116330 [Virgisporangium aurantiacum]